MPNVQTSTGAATMATCERTKARLHRFADGASHTVVTMGSASLITTRWAAHTGQFLALALGTCLVVGSHSIVAASLLLGFGAGVALSGSV